MNTAGFNALVGIGTALLLPWLSLFGGAVEVPEVPAVKAPHKPDAGGDLSPEEQAKQEDKHNAVDSAKTWRKAGDVSLGWTVFLGGAAAGAAMPAPEAGLVFGVSAAVTAWSAAAFHALANRYKDIAADPPRADFHLVSRFSPRQLAPDPAATNAEAALQHVTKLACDLGDALQALLDSYERHDGVKLATAQPAPAPQALEEWKRCEILQVEAIAANAAACADLTRDLVAIAPTVNDALQQVKAALPSDLLPVPELPALLFDDEWRQQTETTSLHHRKVADTYGALKQSLLTRDLH